MYVVRHAHHFDIIEHFCDCTCFTLKTTVQHIAASPVGGFLEDFVAYEAITGYGKNDSAFL